MDNVASWNTTSERMLFNIMVDYTNKLIEDEESSLSDDSDDSSISSVSSMSTDSSSSSDSSIGEQIRSCIEFGTLIFLDSNSKTKKQTYRQNDLVINDLVEESFDKDIILEFRFRKQHLAIIIDRLWPLANKFLDGNYERVHIGNRNYVHFETGFLLCLYRLSYPKRIRPDMENRFGMSPTRISLSLITFMTAFYKVSLPYFSRPKIWLDHMPYYASLINNKTDGVAKTVWGFIDGTLRKTCRPTYYQKLLYSGHKRHHGIKFQSVTTPDGFIALLYGPVPGSRHDSFMLYDSEILPQLRELMPQGTQIYSIYGDTAYPQSAYIFGGYRGAAQGSIEAEFNTKMSSVRETVEWGFKDIISQFSFLDFKIAQKIFKMPLAQYYMVGSLFQNIRVCFYGSETSNYFGAIPMSFDQYLSLVKDDDIVDDEIIE